jgi:hypothetical protein
MLFGKCCCFETRTQLVVVEVPWRKLVDQLPKTLFRARYGI